MKQTCRRCAGCSTPSLNRALAQQGLSSALLLPHGAGLAAVLWPLKRTQPGGQRCVGETNPHRTETAPRGSTSSPPLASPPSLAFWKVSFGEHAQSICHGRESQVPSGTAEQQVRPPCEVLSWYSLALGRLQSTPRLHRDYAQQFIYSPK